MTNPAGKKPDSIEYPPHFEKYISLVPDTGLLDVLNRQLRETLELLSTIPEAYESFRYGPDKWSTKELLGHVIDCERIFSCRALRFARNDKAPLPGFDQDEYARSASYGDYSLSELALEFKSVRESSVFLFQHLNDGAWNRTGTADGREVSVRALGYIIAGHELHHREVLVSRYLSPAGVWQASSQSATRT